MTSRQLGPDASRTVDSLCRVADFALYSSKTSGRGRLTQYNQILEGQYFERRTLVESLPGAIARGELDLYLQPKVFLPGREVYGFEALVRWVRDSNIVRTEELIRIAEESGRIFELDKYVLDVAAREIAYYNRVNGTGVSVSVNLSALHFNTRRIVGWVDRALEVSGLLPHLLTLEITESAELRDWEQAQFIMGELRALGSRISIDDFGTGYSSLSYLRSAIVDEVKIDRTIIEQIATSDEARFLLDGVLDIAGNLGLGVVVEGVATPEQARILTEMGADRAQGYLFGKPMLLRDAIEALDGTVVRRDEPTGGPLAKAVRKRRDLG
ncbi:EAL domain-containing protein [Marimonas sp. MJW-29]|uniref:EAL domain-containing protein n=1 Tax=Sulfitobacter sediminis TaxID=3234186 RepID=A0ABV3RI36_9RHOB